MLSPTDYQHLKATYATLFDHEILDIQMTRSIKIYKNITLYGQFIGSIKHPQTKHSAYLLAAWTDSNGNISEDKIRPGKVLYFLSHKIKEDDHFVEHLFALVAWFNEHPYQFHYGKPLEVWKTNFISDGPSSFLPVNKIMSRCLTCSGRLTCPDNSSAAEEIVRFVLPIPNMLCY